MTLLKNDNGLYNISLENLQYIEKNRIIFTNFNIGINSDMKPEDVYDKLVYVNTSYTTITEEEFLNLF